MAQPLKGQPQRLSPGQKALSVLVIGCVIVATVGAYLVLSPPKAAVTGTLFSGTVSTAPGTGAVQASIAPPAANPTKVLLTLETPNSGQPLPGNLSLTLGTNSSPVWVWPGSFGSWSNPGGAPALVSANGSQSLGLSLPRSTILGGSASVSAVHGPLVSPYSVAFSVGSDLVLDRNSSSGWLPFAQLPWAQTHNGTTALTAAQMPNGTSLLGVGEPTGYLDVFAYAPGSPGELVFRTDISAPTPLSLLCGGDLSNQGIPTIVTAEGPVVSVVTPAQGGVWSQHPILIDPFSNRSPSVQALVTAPMSDGASSIVISTDAGALEISNWSRTGTGPAGWSPFQRLWNLPSDTFSLSSALSPSGTTFVAAADGSGVSLLSLNSSTLLGSQWMGLPTGVQANAVAFNSTGLGLIIAGSDGNLYHAESPNWTATAMTLPDGGRAVLSVSVDRAPQGDIAIASVGDNRVFVVENPFRAPGGSVTTVPLPTGDNVADLSFGSIFGRSQPDLLAISGTGIWSSESELMFQSAAIGNWTSDLQGALSQLTPQVDAYGNSLVDIPLTLGVRGGAAELESPTVFYNTTIVIDVTKDLAQAGTASGGKGAAPQLTLVAGTPGSLHVELTAYYRSPPSIVMEIDSFLAADILPLLGGVLLSGVALVVAGGLLYDRQGTARVASREGPRKAPRRGG